MYTILNIFFKTFFFLFWEETTCYIKIKSLENHPTQKTWYPLEHTPTRFEKKERISLVGLKHTLLHCLANLHERKKYSENSLNEKRYLWWDAPTRIIHPRFWKEFEWERTSKYCKLFDIVNFYCITSIKIVDGAFIKKKKKKKKKKIVDRTVPLVSMKKKTSTLAAQLCMPRIVEMQYMEKDKNILLHCYRY